MKNQLYLTFFSLLFTYNLFAQRLTTETDVCPAVPVQFNAPTIPNTSRYDWDFCSGDLLQTPSGELITPFISNVWRPEGIEIAYDDKINEWVGFITNRADGSLTRVNFGVNLRDIPTYTELGTLGNSISSQANGPRNLKLFKQAGNWFGVLLHLATNALRVYSFGNSLKNTPSLNFLSSMSQLTIPAGLDLAYENGNQIALIPNYNANPILINFSNSILGSSPSIISLPNLPANNEAYNAKLLYYNGIWYGLIAGLNGRFYLINFGSSLFDNDPPIYTDLTPQIPAGIDFQDLHFIQDGKNAMAFTVTASGNLHRFDFGESLSLPTPTIRATNMGNFRLLGIQGGGRPSLSFEMIKNETEWFMFVINRDPNNVAPANINQFVRLRFPNACGSNPGYSTQTNPSASFSVGKKIIQLTTYDSNDNFISNIIDSVNVLDATVAQFSTQNQCLGETTQFVNISVGSDSFVSSWEWDFGDNSSSNLKNPTKLYNQAGLYSVKLKVINKLGCINTFTRNIRISRRPVADFDIISLDCSTGSIILKDKSDVTPTDKINGGFIVSRTWDFGDGRGYIAAPDTITYLRKGLPITNPPINSPLQVDNVPYQTTQSYQITLTVVDETGCASSVVKTITFRNQDAPVVNFSRSGACQGVPIQFQDTSVLPTGVSGQIMAWDWTFFNPNGVAVRATSNQPNPRHTYTEPGVYPIKLSVRNSNGCISTLMRNLTIEASLNSSFNTSATSGVVPFTVQFFNQTGGASSYLWNFDNGQISTLESPTYTFNTVGIYDVSFQARNAVGCGTIATQRIIVGDSPTAIEDFNKLPFKIYPNPTESGFNLEFYELNSKPTQIILRDLLGKEIFNQKLEFTEKSHLFSMDALPSGLYLIQVKVDDKSYLSKIIKK
jgi:PKD repeat protein